MRVRDLIAELKTINPDAPVKVVFPTETGCLYTDRFFVLNIDNAEVEITPAEGLLEDLVMESEGEVG